MDVTVSITCLPLREMEGRAVETQGWLGRESLDLQTQLPPGSPYTRIGFGGLAFQAIHEVKPDCATALVSHRLLSVAILKTTENQIDAVGPMQTRYPGERNQVWRRLWDTCAGWRAVTECLEKAWTGAPPRLRVTRCPITPFHSGLAQYQKILLIF